MSADDIDILASTRRRAITAKVLRQQYGARYTELGDHIRAAAAVLLALDEDINEREITGGLREAEPTGPSVEQQIRIIALQAVQSQISLRSAGVDTVLSNAEQVAAYIRDGKVGE